MALIPISNCGQCHFFEIGKHKVTGNFRGICSRMKRERMAQAVPCKFAKKKAGPMKGGIYRIK